MSSPFLFFFFFNDTATTEIYTLSLHDALPIWPVRPVGIGQVAGLIAIMVAEPGHRERQVVFIAAFGNEVDRKSTRLNSSHSQISYAVFCLKKKKKIS